MNDRRADGPNIEVDAVMASVIQGALENIAVEMGYKLMRMSYSSIIRESEDFGAGLVDARGRGLAESAQSTPLQSGPIPGYVRGMMRVLDERGETLRPGDVIMHNDAYAGASHGPDVAFIVPVFVDEALAGYSVTTAHHLDIGALTPGSCGIVDAMDAYAEGTPVPRDQGLRRGTAGGSGVAHAARQHPGLGPRGRRHGSPGRGEPNRRRAPPHPHRTLRRRPLRDRLRVGDEPCGPPHALGHREAARRRLPGRDPHRRLPGQPGSRQAGAAPGRLGHHRRRRDDRRPHRDRRPGPGSAHQHAARRHRRRRGVADGSIGSARYRRARPHPGQRRAHPRHQDRGSRRAASPTRSFRPPPSPASAPAISSPTP